MKLMKSQVRGHFVLSSDVDCSLLSAGSSNTPLPGRGGLTWQRLVRYHAVSSGTRQEYSYLAKNHMPLVVLSAG
jgi:hypothetical protein